MRTSSDLYNLIDSMNQTEKRYFKVFASKHVIGKKNNYIKLFEAISKQSEYNEADIRQKLKNEKFIKQLPVAKNYLYNLILKSLNLYNLEKSVSSGLNEIIRSVEILYKKNLYQQAEKLLDKAKLVAEKYQKFPLMIEILHWKRILISRKPYYDDMDKNFDEIFRDECDTLEKLSNLSKYSDFSGKAIVISKKKLVLRTAEDEERIHKILENPLLSSEEMALSYEAKNLFYFVKVLNSYKIGNMSDANEYLKKQINLINSNPKLLTENIDIYIRSLINLLVIQKKLKNINESINTIGRIRALPETHREYISENNHLTIFYSSYYIELTLYIETGQFEKALSLLEIIKPELRRLDSKLGEFRKSMFYFQFAKLYFINCNYNDAIFWLNKILNDTTGRTAEDIQCHSRLLNLIIHFEIMDYDLIEYNLKSTYRFLSKRKQLYEFEKTILKYLTKTFRIKTEQELELLFINLRKELISLSKSSFDRDLIEELNLIEWLESKIENKNFTELLKQKYEHS